MSMHKHNKHVDTYEHGANFPKKLPVKIRISRYSF